MQKKSIRRLAVEETGNYYDIYRDPSKTRPGIRIKGKWLAQAGFKAGEKVVVEVHNGQLVIKRQDGAA